MRYTLVGLAAVASIANAQPGHPANDPDSWRAAGTAKIFCSGLFVSGRDSAELRSHLNNYFLGASIDSITRIEIDRRRQSVRLSVANRPAREAKRYGEQGCIIQQPGRDSIYFKPFPVPAAPAAAANVPWPMGDAAPSAPISGIDTAKVRQGVEAAFANPAGLTAGVVVVHKGRIVGEKYGQGASAETQLESWSMGKSIMGTLMGMLIQRGDYTLDQRAPVAEWQKQPNDPRAAIRIRDLMQMSSGLRFSRGSPEDLPGYHDHDLIYTGAINAFEFAATREQQFPPGTRGRYRNDNVMLLGLLFKQAVEKRGEDYLTWPQRRLFDKIGIRRQTLETDPYGQFLISGYDYGTPRNWARIGQLYLNDGVAPNGERLLPPGWTKFVSAPAPGWADSTYGGMVWVNARKAWPALPTDAFAFRGAGGQDTFVVPSLDLVVVRMGHYSGARAGGQDLQQRALPLIVEAITGRKP
jgi:CubicO group peptidase (beta-lactamase class C family)